MHNNGRLIWIAALIVGLFAGFTISAVQYRFVNAKDPLVVTVEGELGSPVTVRTSGSASRGARDTIEVHKQGSGRAVSDGQVLARVTNFRITPGKDPLESGQSYIVGTAPEDIPSELTDYIQGRAEGSRVVGVEPEAGSALVRVVDILPTVITGEQAATSAGGGLPALSVTDAGIPVVSAGGGEVGTYAQVDLIEGTGAQIGPRDVVAVNYMLIAPDGTVKESTWDQASPTVLNVDEVFPGLRTGLVDSRVGTRMVLAVPAEQARGDSDVALVVDVLAKVTSEQ
ncbi:FKBP-type peptidyl-prolyl cis-trans isomerase [Trueperella bialowiezensis]|uniref:Peptidyl-prolyl cis-trans isomerase n=1 Tax=Trueperella bialowiezensis TaxID=312285 RepID=A0A3S4V5A1_9ACTO|nr:FKBP-type peptidyl-prolyl cis-trans isomerase [Trueperella bialowiezensis]VEI12381.1 FKBP-type peptidyl-prolyl cis-trans isomerase [Trueperella bialowiezensis]